MKSSNKDNGWIAGRLYFNRKDKRVIIKRPESGFGYTMNLGNKETWIFNIISVIIIVILVTILQNNFYQLISYSALYYMIPALKIIS